MRDIFFFWGVKKGYFEVTPTTEQNDGESLSSRDIYHNFLLPLLWMLWICSFWEQHPREPLDRIWILRAVLAY